MKGKARKVYERVYIHAAKVQTTEGWALVIHAMDAYSEYVFQTVFSKTPEVTTEVLDQLFDSILKDYKPIFHPRQIIFITNLPEECGLLLPQTQAAHHRFIFDKDVTAKAMQGLLSRMPYKMAAL
jgi:hypothetical protein